MSSIRSASANGRANVRTAPGSTRQRVLERKSTASAAGSATQLPSLGVTGSAFYRGGNGSVAGGSKPPLPLGISASQKGGLFSSNGRTRQGNPDAKEDKATAVITLDDL